MWRLQFAWAALRALITARPGYETFFGARLRGYRFSYGDKPLSCTLTFNARKWMLNARWEMGHGGETAYACDTAIGHLLHYAGYSAITKALEVDYQARLLPGNVEVIATTTDRLAEEEAWINASVFQGGKPIAFASAIYSTRPLE